MDIRTEHTTGTPRIALDHCGSGHAVVFLHAIGGNRTNWRDQLPAFGAHFHALAFDTRGYGDSDDYEGPFRMEDAANDLLRVLDHFGHWKAHLVGLSMGGRLILDFYERHRARVKSLVLCATFHTSEFMSARDWSDFRSRRSDRLLAGEKPADIAEDVADTLVARGAAPDVRRRVVESMAALHKDGYIKAIDGIQGYRKAADLQAIDVPVMVVAGEHDRPSTPSYCEWMAHQTPRARFRLTPSAAHMLNMEQPEHFNAGVLEFLSSV